jgi:WD40 repeat protein
MRSETSNCHVRIGSAPIDSPIVSHPNVLLAMNEPSHRAAGRRGSASPTLVVAALALLAALAIAVILSLSPYHSTPHLTAVAFSPDGRFLAAGDLDGSIAVWRLPSLQPEARIRLEEGALNVLSFSPDSRLLAVAGRSLRLWSTTGWTPLLSLGPPGAGYGTARFSPSGSVLATVNVAERIELWDVASGKRVRTLCCMALYGDLAFSPDGAVLAAGGHWPRLWDLAAGHEILRLVQTREPAFGAIAFSPDGRALATGSQDGTARLWEAAYGRQLRCAAPREGYVESVAFHPKGTLLAYGVRRGAVWLWDTAAGSERQLAPIATSNISFSPDGRWLAFATPPASIRLWDIPGNRPGPALAFAPR